MRHKFEHNGQVVYEWEQSLTEVIIFIDIPEGVKAKQLYVDLSTKTISLGISPNPPYLQVIKTISGSALQLLKAQHNMCCWSFQK